MCNIWLFNRSLTQLQSASPMSKKKNNKEKNIVLLQSLDCIFVVVACCGNVCLAMEFQVLNDIFHMWLRVV